MERKITGIYVHCSASSWGNENVINHWHKARRFLMQVIGDGYQISTGYHLVIGNGKPFKLQDYIGYLDGNIETARPFYAMGAGVQGDNVETIHICLIGEAGKFTDSQMDTLFMVLAWHVEQGIDISEIKGHYEYWTDKGLPARKTCPGIDMKQLRSDLAKYMLKGEISAAQDLKLDPVRSWRDVALDALNFLLGGKRG